MSGSKQHNILLLITAFLLGSCGLFGAAHRDNKPVVTTRPSETTTVTVDTAKRKKTDSVITPTKVINDELSLKKSLYNLTYVLPFSTDAAELEKLSTEENITGFQPLASIEFYEGALMALDTLDSLGIKLDIHVYNHYKDSSLTAALFSKPEIVRSDVVIGPVFNESLKAASLVAQKNNFFLVSPLSPNNSFIDTNKYFLMVNPTVEAQLEAMLKQIAILHPNANIINLYRSDKPAEKRLGDEFKKAFSAANNANTMRITDVAGYSEAVAAMKPADNFIFLASYDELFVNGLVRDLSKFSRETPLELLGLQHLLSFESISIDYYENLHFTYPNTYYVNRDAPRVKAFEDAFIEKYSTRPSDFACRGYDLTLYIAMMLAEYGPDLGASAGKYNKAERYMLDPVRFAAEKNDTGAVRYYEKSNITILRYDQFRFEVLQAN